jgi:DNA-directed RNA polymerase subunit M/transcription elongation factor TFIIS
LKIYNLKCPNCGATLTTDVKSNYAKCDYCGNEFHISEKAKNETKELADSKTKGAVQKESEAKSGHTSGLKPSAADPEKRKRSRIRDVIIVSLIVVTGLALSLVFDKKAPQEIVPKTDLHRFFIELRPDSTPQTVETLAQKHKLHFFRTEKAVNSDMANINYYKIAKTMETALDKQGAHAETVEIEFDLAKNNAFRLAVYSDPDHVVSRALLFKYGTYYSLSAKDPQGKDAAGYYYYNNSLRNAPGEQETHPPYLKCADAAEALRKIYTYRK